MLCQFGPCHYPLDGKILCAAQNNKMIEVPNGFNHLMNKYLNCLIMISNISVYIYIYIYTYIFKSICMLNVVKTCSTYFNFYRYESISIYNS